MALFLPGHFWKWYDFIWWPWRSIWRRRAAGVVKLISWPAKGFISPPADLLAWCCGCWCMTYSSSFAGLKSKRFFRATNAYTAYICCIYEPPLCIAFCGRAKRIPSPMLEALIFLIHQLLGLLYIIGYSSNSKTPKDAHNHPNYINEARRVTLDTSSTFCTHQIWSGCHRRDPPTKLHSIVIFSEVEFRSVVEVNSTVTPWSWCYRVL